MAKHERKRGSVFDETRGSASASHAAKHGRKGGLWWKILLIAFCTLAGLVLIGFSVIYFTLGRANIEPYKKEATYGGQDILDGNLPAIDESGGEDVASRVTLPSLSSESLLGSDGEPDPSTGEQNPENPLGELIENDTTIQQLMRNWCANGQPVSSSHVLNILLIGMDHDNINYNSRADSLILLSINTQTKTITFASILRDHYAYIQTSAGESFEKMSFANVRGGPELMISTIEAHYKVQIDNYIMISMGTFPKIIDRLGGVTLTLTQAEADALGSDFVAGEQLLDGEHALKYSRLRRLDSEQERTGRQRKVLSALLNELRGASLVDLVGVINDLLPYVRTGLTQTQMISYATRAISEGWMSYGTQQFYTPSGSCWQGRTIDDLWYWLVDYPVAAYEFQMKLYGTSNIVLAPDRTSFLRYPVR